MGNHYLNVKVELPTGWRNWGIGAALAAGSQKQRDVAREAINYHKHTACAAHALHGIQSLRFFNK